MNQELFTRVFLTIMQARASGILPGGFRESLSDLVQASKNITQRLEKELQGMETKEDLNTFDCGKLMVSRSTLETAIKWTLQNLRARHLEINVGCDDWGYSDVSLEKFMGTFSSTLKFLGVEVDQSLLSSPDPYPVTMTAHRSSMNVDSILGLKPDSNPDPVPKPNPPTCEELDAKYARFDDNMVVMTRHQLDIALVKYFDRAFPGDSISAMIKARNIANELMVIVNE